MAPSTQPMEADGLPGFKARGRTVAELRAETERRGLKAEYVVMWLEGDGGGEGYAVDVQHVKDDWTVESVVPIASDAVRVHVKARPGVPPGSLPTAPAQAPDSWWRE